MVMNRLLLAVATAALAMPCGHAIGQAAAAARGTTTELGTITTSSHVIRVAIHASGARKDASLFIADRAIFRGNLSMLTPAEMRRLKAMLDEAIVELEAVPPVTQQPAPTPKTPDQVPIVDRSQRP